MLLRPFLNDSGACASYLFGCTSTGMLAVMDAHADLVEEYLTAAAAIGAPITAVFETHVHADHVSGLPALVERTGATAYLPAAAQVEFDHVALDDAETVELGNTVVTAIETPGHAPAHHAYTVADRRRGDDEPWLVFSGDSLLIGDVGLSGNPFSSIGFERSHNPLLAIEDPDAFADALLTDIPPRPIEQERIVAANRAGKVSVPA